jgi:hypothetical protein
MKINMRVLENIFSISFDIQLSTNIDVKKLFIAPDHSSIDFLLNFASQHIKIGQINKPIIGQR